MSFLKKLFSPERPSTESADQDDSAAGPGEAADRERLVAWSRALQETDSRDPTGPVGRLVARAAELTAGSPYAFKRLDAYVNDEAAPTAVEPLTLSLTHFESVTLIDSCVALARCARMRTDSWDAFAREVEQLRYRGGRRGGYASRLHYFSEWITDNAARGNVRDMSPELGGVEDARPLRYMTAHRSGYRALEADAIFREIAAHEERLERSPRWVIPPEQVPAAAERIEPGDIVAFTTGVKGLDVSHVGIASRDGAGALRIIQALFATSKVEVMTESLTDYLTARRSTGIMVARPL